jgi:predicted TPR repeat methyltransferase
MKKKSIYDLIQKQLDAREFHKAEKVLKELIKYNSKDIAALSGMAYICLEQNKFAETISLVDQALLIEKSSSQLYYFNALANYRTGNIEKAKHFLDKSKACFPNYSSINTLAKSIELSELEQSDSHHLNIKYKFDRSPTEYDEGRSQANYDTPTLIFNEVSRLKQGNFNRILDLGCGTGLSGGLFRKESKYLCGVDLSSEMMELALQRNIYDELIEMDILNYLNTCQPKSFDVIIASSVFIYFGKLDQLFLKIEKILNDDGVLCFDLNLDEYSDNFSIFTLNGMQFKHGKNYVHDCAHEAGLIHENTIESSFEYITVGEKCPGNVYSFSKK